MLTGDVWCLVTDLASNCVLTIIEDVSGDAEANVLILLSLLYATHALNQGVMVWGAISLGNRIPLVIIRSTKARPHSARVDMNCLTACQTILWPARSLFNRACLEYDGKATASTREC
ncbi:uncharacterized protein TNCV_2020341 [Trichonephila clavipes]|nr:uncharacterized protein TNCV_2020341 [Trichonephila clavipes]